ncbi:WD40-repeat-containing domain protein [Mycena amicta]|nr:WD40-repeat-containing domain protein [Mycena amicta]
MLPPFLSRTPYTKHNSIKHRGGIANLAASADGKFLASGGFEGTQIWNISDLTKVRSPAPKGQRGATCSLLWVRQMDEAEEVLWYGTQNGYVCAWRQFNGYFEEVFLLAVYDIAEISCLAFDAVNSRLAFGTRASRVQSWRITAKNGEKWHGDIVFDVVVEDPGAIAFDDHGRERAIFVYGSQSPGRVWTLRGSTGRIDSSWDAGAGTGYLAQNRKQGLFVLGDMSAGPAIYRYSDTGRTKSLDVPRQRDWLRPTQVCWADQGTTVISGSDHGYTHIHDARSGKREQKFCVSKSGEWVQAVAVAEVAGVSMIFAAQTRMTEGLETIVVLKRSRTVGWTFFMEWVFWPLMVLGFIAAVAQNFVVPQISAFGGSIPIREPAGATESASMQKPYSGVSVIRI